MNGEYLNRHFARMGARIKLDFPANRRGSRSAPLTVDVRRDADGEYFEIRRNPADVALDVLDVRPKERHLLLLARLDNGARKDKFVCGHDERAWFAAAVPNVAGVSNVRTALEALRPATVRLAASDARLGFGGVYRRRTPVYTRQGEWFFVPAPSIRPQPWMVLRNEPLRRGNGKPHWAEMLFRSGGEPVYIRGDGRETISAFAYERRLARNPDAVAKQGWRLMMRNPEAYVRGRIRHSDHATIVLDGWHRVAMNRENEAPAMRHLAFLD